MEFNLEYIESLVESVEYVNIPGAMNTTCCLTVKGGAEVVGVSYCFDPAKFSTKVGREAAYKDAIDELFKAEAYHLKRLSSES